MTSTLNAAEERYLENIWRAAISAEKDGPWTPGKWDIEKKASEKLEEMDARTGNKFASRVLTLGSDIMSAACPSSLGAWVLAGFAKSAAEGVWTNSHQTAYDAVCVCLADSKRDLNASIESEKAASLKSSLGQLIGKATSKSPGLLTLLLGSSAALGAGAGTAAWFMGRDSDEDSVKNQVTKERIKLYRRVNSDLERELKSRGLLADDAQPETEQRFDT